MSAINFTSKAGTYAENALVQKSASEVLLNLINIGCHDDVLDLGCGPGNITRKISTVTQGKVIGTDLSEGMITEANRVYSGQENMSFMVRDAEEMGFNEEFDVIYCNSAFQWFNNPEKVLEECNRALRENGRMGIQAPATANFCPNFVEAIEEVQKHPATAKIFASFQSPWFFLDTAMEYKNLFARAGFSVTYCEITMEKGNYTSEQVYKIFQSGAENGYLNQGYYSNLLTEEYIRAFRSIVKETIKKQSNKDGKVELQFFRIYLVAKK